MEKRDRRKKKHEEWWSFIVAFRVGMLFKERGKKNFDRFSIVENNLWMYVWTSRSQENGINFLFYFCGIAKWKFDCIPYRCSLAVYEDEWKYGFEWHMD